MRRAVAILIALSAVQWATGQRATGQHETAQRAAGQSVSVAFWNVENLYDTIPSPFYDDREFTPGGANRWNTARYRAKIESIAAVLDELGADIVGLAEVENEGVVRDLVTAMRTDYNYIHRTSGDGRGIDQALLYKGDKFFPDEGGVRLLESGMGREFLLVSGELASGGGSGGGSGSGPDPDSGSGPGPGGGSGPGQIGERIHLIVTHMASNMNTVTLRRRNMAALRTALETILTQDPAAAIITMGDMNAGPRDRIIKQTLGPLASPWDMMYTPHGAAHVQRQGSYSYRGRWLMYDWMMTSPAIARGTTLRIAAAGIFAQKQLTTADASGTLRPRRTFYGGEYEGGPSDHFPVWMTIVK